MKSSHRDGHQIMVVVFLPFFSTRSRVDSGLSFVPTRENLVAHVHHSHPSSLAVPDHCWTCARRRPCPRERWSFPSHGAARAVNSAPRSLHRRRHFRSPGQGSGGFRSGGHPLRPM